MRSLKDMESFHQMTEVLKQQLGCQGGMVANEVNNELDSTYKYIQQQQNTLI